MLGELTLLLLFGFGHGGLPPPGPLENTGQINCIPSLNCMENITLCIITQSNSISGCGWGRKMLLLVLLHVHSWHARAHGVMWRSHAAAKVLQKKKKKHQNTKKAPFICNHTQARGSPRHLPFLILHHWVPEVKRSLLEIRRFLIWTCYFWMNSNTEGSLSNRIKHCGRWKDAYEETLICDGKTQAMCITSCHLKELSRANQPITVLFACFAWAVGRFGNYRIWHSVDQSAKQQLILAILVSRAPISLC